MHLKAKVAILTSPNQWFIPYAKALQRQIPQCDLYFSCEDFKQSYTLLYPLIPLCLFSYHKILSSDFLRQHKHNLVIHSSNLPKGKGWSPLFWQVYRVVMRLYLVFLEPIHALIVGILFAKNFVFRWGLSFMNCAINKQRCVKICA